MTKQVYVDTNHVDRPLIIENPLKKVIRIGLVSGGTLLIDNAGTISEVMAGSIMIAIAPAWSYLRDIKILKVLTGLI